MEQQQQQEDGAPSCSGGEGHPDPAPAFGAIMWAAPLDWLEEIIPGSPVLESLRRSLSRPSSSSRPQTSAALHQTPTFVKGSAPFEVKTPTLQGAGATPLSPASVEVLDAHLEGGADVAEPTAALPQTERTSTPISLAGVAIATCPSKLSAAGDESTFLAEGVPIVQPDTSTSLSVSAASPASCKSNLQQIGGNVMEESSGFTETSCPVSVAPASIGTSPINPSEVGMTAHIEEEASLLETGASAPISVASAERRVSSPSVPEANAITATEDLFPNVQQEERTDTLHAPSIDAKESPFPSPNVPEIGSGVSILQKQGGYPGTPFTVASAAASASPPNLSEAGEGTATEVGGTPTSCPLGCRCHGAWWTSPLSLLEAEADSSAEGRGPACQPGTGGSTTAGAGASAKVWAASSRLPAPGSEMRTSSALQTPVSVASTATWTTPPCLLGVGVNTSPAEKAATKDNAAETDSLLWRCSRAELSGLSRSELEGRLESTLIIVEALSRQMRACQDSRASGAPTGPADQRDAGTQTPVSDPKEEEQLYHHLYAELRGRYQALVRSRESEKGLAQRLDVAIGEMQTWRSDSGKLLETVDASYLRIREDRRSLALQQKQLADLVSQCRNKLEKSGQKRAEMKEEMEKALRVKEAAELALDSVRTHAGTRIRRLEQSLESQKSLLTLLQEAIGYQADLSLEYNRATGEMDCRATALRERWVQMRHDHERFTSMVTKCLLATKKRTGEAEAAKKELAQHREVCRKLEERTVEVVEALGRVNQLTEAKAALERDLTEALQRLDIVERQNEELHQEKGGLSRQLAEAQDSVQKLEEAAARLSQKKAVAEQERDAAQRDAREASDCREFMEQENRIARRQLAETEEELKATLGTLRVRSAQLEDLKDAHRTLQEERETLRADLAASEAEIQSTRVGMEGLSKSLLEMKGVHSQFLEMVDFLRAAVSGEASDVAQKSLLFTPGRPTPSRPGSSFVESVLQAAADKDSRTPGLLSETTAFTKTAPVRPPTPSEVQRDFLSCLQELRGDATRLRHLIARRQEAAAEEAQRLEAKIFQLRQSSEALEQQLEAEREAGGAKLARVKKALDMQIENEKGLQKVIRQQEGWLRTLSDQSGEIALLKEEVSQLKYALRKSETEVATLWEELRATKPSEENGTREKIWLRQEVGKLRDLLLRKDDERVELQSKYLGQVRSLEGQLHQAKQELKKQEKAATEVKGALSALPQDIASSTS